MSWFLVGLALLAEAGAMPSPEDDNCTPGTTRPVVGRCRLFQNCTTESVWMASTCPEGEFFDPTDSNCKSSSLVECFEASVVCNLGTTYPLAGDCGAYLKCGPNNDYTIETCPSSTLYDTSTSSCQPDSKVNCSKSLNCSDVTKRTIPDNNKVYEECIDGYWTIVDCPEDSVFVFDKQMCVLPLETELKVITCKEGDMSGIEGKCDWYYLCKDRKKVMTKCPLLKRFDQKKKECDWFYKVSCSTCVDGQKFPSKNCKMYYECENGVFNKKSCPELQLFDEPRNECYLSLIATCAKCECDYNSTKIQVDCNHYKECQDCKFVVRKCPLLHHFVVKDDACDWSFRGDCSPMECTKEGQRVPKVDDCQHFFECRNGILVTEKCRFGYYFDQNTTVCLPRDVANCSLTYYEDVEYLESRKPNEDSTILKNFKEAIPDSNLSTTTTDIPPPVTTICTPGETRKVNGSCKNYILCGKTGGFWVNKSCTSWCKNFDGTECVWAWKFPCFPPTERPQCEDGSKKLDPNNCKDYYQCISGSFVKKSCSWYQNFNPQKLQCEITFWPFCK